jgi:hypothetical protein
VAGGEGDGQFLLAGVAEAVGVAVFDEVERSIARVEETVEVAVVVSKFEAVTNAIGIAVAVLDRDGEGSTCCDGSALPQVRRDVALA